MSNKMLAYARSISPTFGRMYFETENGRHPLTLDRITIRGTKSQAKVKETEQGDANIQTVDVCFLPENSDRLVIEYGVKFTPSSVKPENCDSDDVRENFDEFTERMYEQGGYRDLSERYLDQIGSGEWAWKNNDYAASREVVIRDGERTVRFSGGETQDLDGRKAMIDAMAHAMAGKIDRPYRIEVEGSFDMGPGQEVFPSQEFVEAGQSNKEGGVSKVLCGLSYKGREIRHAALHPQKIGNAIRRIDRWHGQGDFVISVEPYGAVTTEARAHRPNRNAFYTLRKLPRMRKRVSALKDGEEYNNDDLFVLACLIRGGVYGEGGE